MEKEFFNKYINMPETKMLKVAIYGQCRIMDKEDIYNWIYEDELELKKQKEIIDKIKKYIEKWSRYYGLSMSMELGTHFDNISQILEDKEVSE